MKHSGAASDFLYVAVLCISLVTISHSNDVQDRFIVGGTHLAAADFPYFAVISGIPGFTNETYPRLLCGAGMIGGKWIITAGRCVSSVRMLKVAFGVEEINAEGGYAPSAEEFEPEAVYLHPHFQKHRGDIALIEMPESFTLSRKKRNFTQSLTLPKKNEEKKYVEKGDVATVAGFGLNGRGGFRTAQLSAANVTIFKRDTCRKHTKAYNHKSHMCAGSRDGFKGTCDGDEGGPLVIKTPEKAVILGIVSYRSTCGSSTPDVYTKVSQYVRWIKAITSKY